MRSSRLSCTCVHRGNSKEDYCIQSRKWCPTSGMVLWSPHACHGMCTLCALSLSVSFCLSISLSLCHSAFFLWVRMSNSQILLQCQAYLFLDNGLIHWKDKQAPNYVLSFIKAILLLVCLHNITVTKSVTILTERRPENQSLSVKTFPRWLTSGSSNWENTPVLTRADNI